MPSTGTVREWDDEQGWGVVDSADTPGGCWVHFSHIAADGYRTLRRGDGVAFTWEAVEQDGFGFRAVTVWPPGTVPGSRRQPGPESTRGAYQSRLRIRWADGTVTEGLPED